MLKRDALLLLLLWAFQVAADSVASTTSTNSTPIDLSLLDASQSDFNVSAEGSFEIDCDGTIYGINPPLSDCESAREQIAPDSAQQTFGERHTGLPPDTFPLPYIMMGSM